MGEIKQMRLSDFSKVYGIPKQTVVDWSYDRGFPAYRLNRRWYVDIPKAEKWIQMNRY